MAPTPYPTSSTLVLELGDLEWGAEWRRGACHSPAQRPLPQSLGVSDLESWISPSSETRGIQSLELGGDINISA